MLKEVTEVGSAGASMLDKLWLAGLWGGVGGERGRLHRFARKVTPQKDARPQRL